MIYPVIVARWHCPSALLKIDTIGAALPLISNGALSDSGTRGDGNWYCCWFGARVDDSISSFLQ